MLKVLHSSAGAGKTHALVKYYLQHALGSENPSAYARVLAITFTNKAANEMRERILRYLRGLSSAEPSNAAIRDVFTTVMQQHGLSQEDVRTRAQGTLSHMLHNWPRLAVTTIDAFTRRVVMPFARDLRLDSELRMTTEEAFYRDLAVDALLARAGTDDGLTRLLLAVCEQLQDEERRWDPSVPLSDLSEQLTKEQAIPYLAALRQLENDRLLMLRQGLRERIRTFRDRIRTLGREALQALQHAGLGAEDLVQGARGPYAFLKQMAAFEEWLEPKTYTLKALETGKWHAGKASAATVSAISSIAPVLERCIGEVEELRALGELQRHAIACAVSRDLLPTAALHLLDEQLEAIKRDEGVTFFSDLVRRVAEIVQREPAPFLYERLGERYTHFLIDEFQDTSMLQWHSLLPLIENALSGGGSALLVGDAKQAIYRWRNGEARQFRLLPELFGKERMIDGDQREAMLKRAHVPVEALSNNHRSARAIIEFNNDLFAKLRERLPEAVAAFYHAHEQHVVRERAGSVRILCTDPEVPEEEEGNETTRALAFVSESVKCAVSEGYRPGDIAVLVRTKKQGRDVSAQLVADGYMVVSPDGLALGNDPAVRAIISFLAWLHRPDDVSAALAAQLLWELRAEEPSVEPFHGRDVHHWLRDHWKQHPVISTSLPLVSLICAIAGSVGADPATNAFVLGLVDEAHAFVIEHGDDPLTFLEHWYRRSANRSVGGAENTTAIRVMTVHRSKGLQFPVVIVPHANMATQGKRDRLWIDAREVDPELPSALIRPSAAIRSIGIPEVLIEDELELLDRLNLLYVAFTRPEERLYAAIDGKRKDELSSLLRELLQLAPGQTFEQGHAEPAPTRKPVADVPQLSLRPRAGEQLLSLVIRNEAPEEWDPADPDPYRSYGSALHAILARVNTAEDLPAAIAFEAPVWGIHGNVLEQLRTRLEALLAVPDVQPFYRAGARVRNEATLIDVNGHAHRPDRIASDGTGTYVLDIKTGEPARHHHEQVARYVHLLRALGEPNVSGYLLYVRNGTVTRVEA